MLFIGLPWMHWYFFLRFLPSGCMFKQLYYKWRKREKRGEEWQRKISSTIFEKKWDAQKVRERGREEKKERKCECIKQGGHGDWGDKIRWSGKGNG